MLIDMEDEHECEQIDRFKEIFNRLDLKHKGKFNLSQLHDALKEQNHPLSSSQVGVETLFQAMDINDDKWVDWSDFLTFAVRAELQIREGFKKIDKDDDGLIRRSEVSKYLSRIRNKEMTKDVDITSNNHQKNKLNQKTFLYWAFWKRIPNRKELYTHHQNQIKDNPDHYITYNEWRDFLLLMPREKGSRLKTAYQYFYLFNEDLDVNADGDMILNNEFINGFSYFLAGGISGVISRTFTAPLDRIKVFLIARTDLSSTILNSKHHLLELNPNAKLNRLKSPIVKAIESLYKQGGLKSFYVGNGLNSIKVFPESSIKFGTFEITKKILSRLEGHSNNDQLSKLSTYLAGGISGVISQFCSYPIDTVKFRMQCAPLDNQLKGNALLLTTIKNMYKENGIQTFYRGVVVGLLGIFPYAALDLGTFTALKSWYIKKQSTYLNIPRENIELNNMNILTLGALSGTIGATVVYPINSLRTRLQAQGTFAHPHRYKGFWDVLNKTFAKEGLQGLYKGLTPTLMKVCPAVSISYLCYENLKSLTNLH